MAEITYKLNDFEGPLDLLLHLISKHKMQLWEIRIYELIDQYLEFIGKVDREDLDPTSEFIEMAARLVHMKSVSLLPRTEEAEQLEQELTGKLIEYSLCKAAAQKLRDRSEGVNFFIRKPMEPVVSTEYNGRHNPSVLLKAYSKISGKAARKRDVSEFEPLVAAPIVSVESRVIHIKSMLVFGARRSLKELFASPSGRSETVATFLGVLELIRKGEIELDDDGMIHAVKRGLQEDKA